MLTDQRSDAGRGIDDDIYAPPQSSPLLFVVALGVLALVIAVLLSWWIREAGLSDTTSAPSRSAVPDVVGSTEEVATGVLAGAGFIVEVELVLNVDVEGGAVIHQEPARGTLLDRGSVVHLAVSLGSGFVPVPEVTGTLDDQVDAQLAAYGLRVGVIATRQDMSSLKGEILEQVPAPGQLVIRGATIDLVVSEGPPPVDVPDVVGLTQVDATTSLIDAGFTVSPVQMYSSARAGVVVATSPRPGTEAEYGSEIRLFVSRGAAPTTVPPPTTPSTTPGGTPPDDDGPGDDDG